MENAKLHFLQVKLYEFKKGVSVARASKSIEGIYLERVPALRTLKKWFCRFRNGDLNLNDNITSERPGVDNDLIRDLVNNDTLITVEERLNVVN